MTNARTPRLVPMLVLLAAGCSQSNPFVAHRATLGSLKTSVSQLEFKNNQLERQLADMKRENRDLGDRLVQEEAANGDLSARLDDAKALLSSRGVLGESELDRLEPETAAPRTLPAGRTNRKPRRPPFAQIPGRIDSLPPASDEPEAPSDSPSSRGWRGDPGPQSRLEDPILWLPIARGASEPSKPRR